MRQVSGMLRVTPHRAWVVGEERVAPASRDPRTDSNPGGRLFLLPLDEGAGVRLRAGRFLGIGSRPLQVGSVPVFVF